MKFKFTKGKGLLFLLSFFIVLIDQVVKFIITNNLKVYDTITVIKDFFYLTYTKNIGAAYSILEGGQLFLIFVSILFLIFFIHYIMNKKYLSKLSFFSSSFLIGGVIGNLIDRVVHNYVIDFLSFHIFSYDFPIFNIADIFIVIGFILMVIEEVFINDQDNSGGR